MSSTRDTTRWQLRAVCLTEDPELFFPHGESEHFEAEVRDAKDACQVCPVQYECLSVALDRGEVGVWGGTTPQERSIMKRVLAKIPYHDAGTAGLALVLDTLMPECEVCGDHARPHETRKCHKCREPEPAYAIDKPICPEDGCDRPVYKRGLCTRHYYRMRKAESPETTVSTEARRAKSRRYRAKKKDEKAMVDA